MLPQTQWHSRTVTLISLFFIVFSLCSWTLAASIVESRAVPTDTTPDPAPPATTDEDALLPEPGQDTPSNPADQVPASSETPIPAPPAEEQVPADPTGTNTDLQQSVFSTKPYSLEVLRGKGGTDKRIALTFDDGPVAGWTDRYLAILTEKQVPATFFFIGRLAETNADLVGTVVTAGHEIGVHSHTHKKLTGLKEPVIKQELVNSATIVGHITQQPMAYFRPPYGATDSTVAGVAHELGQTVITWNVDPRDWDTKDPQQIIAQVLKQVRPGSIILLHEGKPQTLKALPVIIDRLRQEGYEFVTISGLFEFTPAVPTAADTDGLTTDTVSPTPAADGSSTTIPPAVAPASAPGTGTANMKATPPTDTYAPSTHPTTEPSASPTNNRQPTI